MNSVSSRMFSRWCPDYCEEGWVSLLSRVKVRLYQGPFSQVHPDCMNNIVFLSLSCLYLLNRRMMPSTQGNWEVFKG
jgi:hypothetical protein